MNREQRRKAEKQDAHIDIEIKRNSVYDGAQIRYNARTVLMTDQGLKEVSLGAAIVVEPFITDKEEPTKVIDIDKTECLVMDVIVNPSCRGLGVGTILLNGLKAYYNKMISGVRSDEGMGLAVKCGFKKDENNRFIWDKDWEKDIIIKP
jgi:GNAT superfamily N-acetyltransferase